ncbi:hypothetical protein M1M90_02985, partial [Thermodesulfovibrionales bacterium]|nr:hypothetical protein [Thermodesulfovibrionales bacterium]
LAAMEKKATVYLAVFPRNNSIIVRSVDRRILEEIEGFIRRVDIPTRQVLLEGKILELALTEDFKSFFDFDIEKADKHIIDVGGFTPLDAATFIYQFLDEEIEARLELFEEEGLVRVIGTPMILSANNTMGEFFIGEERPIIVDYEHVREVIPDIGLIETVYPVIEVREVGTRLNITPSINEDGTVTLRFLAEVDTVRPGGAEVSFVGPEGRVITLPIDTVDASRVENIIVASDGSTLAIGGLIRETEKDIERRVPLLGYIPILGFFFKRKEIRDQKTEIIFLVTPHIMMVPGEAEAVSDEVMRRLSDHPYVHPDDGEEEESRVESQESEF